MLSVGIKKALECSRVHSITSARGDLEFLVSRWSVESHTFVTMWADSRPTLKDVLNIMALLLNRETNAMGSTL